MSDILKALERRHREKLDQLEHGEADEALLDGIRLLIADLRQAGASVAAPAERGQLRALMHFWGNVVYDRTEAYPRHDAAPARSQESSPSCKGLGPQIAALLGLGARRWGGGDHHHGGTGLHRAGCETRRTVACGDGSPFLEPRRGGREIEFERRIGDS